jgi:nitrogen fixation protein FixH
MSCCGAFIMPIDLRAPVAPPPARPFELTGRMVLFGMIAFFLVVAGVNAIMMTVAIRTMSGVDTRSAYEASQRYNDEIARMQAQAERGWHAEASVQRNGADAGIVLSLADKGGRPVRGLRVAASLQHPATRAEDRTAALIETAPGRYEASLADLHGGGWTLAFQAHRGADLLFVSRSRILLKD